MLGTRSRPACDVSPSIHIDAHTDISLHDEGQGDEGEDSDEGAEADEEMDNDEEEEEESTGIYYNKYSEDSDSPGEISEANRSHKFRKCMKVDVDSDEELDDMGMEAFEEDAIKQETQSMYGSMDGTSEHGSWNEPFDNSSCDSDEDISPFLDAQEFETLRPALGEGDVDAFSSDSDEELILSYCFVSSSSGSETEVEPHLPATTTPCGKTREIPASDAAPPRLADWPIELGKKVAVLDGQSTATLLSSPLVKADMPDDEERDDEIIDLDELIFTESLLPSTQTNWMSSSSLPQIHRTSNRNHQLRSVMKGEAHITPMKRKKKTFMNRANHLVAAQKWEVKGVELGDLFVGI